MVEFGAFWVHICTKKSHQQSLISLKGGQGLYGNKRAGCVCEEANMSQG